MTEKVVQLGTLTHYKEEKEESVCCTVRSGSAYSKLAGARKEIL